MVTAHRGTCRARCFRNRRFRTAPQQRADIIRPHRVDKPPALPYNNPYDHSNASHTEESHMVLTDFENARVRPDDVAL